MGNQNKNSVNEENSTVASDVVEMKPTPELSAAPTKPNCYKCKFRRDLPGDAHSRCVHPIIGETNSMDAVAAIFASVGRAAPVISEKARDLNVTGNPMGIRRGWFNWPWNFDPTWLQTCDGFEPKIQAANTSVSDGTT